MTHPHETEIAARVRAAMDPLVQDTAVLSIHEPEGLHSLTNWIRRVEDETTGRSYAVRVPNPTAAGPLGIVRSEESSIARFAAEAGFGPPIYATSADGCIVMPFLSEVSHWTGSDIAAQVGGGPMIDAVSTMLTASGIDFPAPTIFDRLRRMLAGAELIGVPVPSEVTLRAHIDVAEQRRDGNYKRLPAISHHDLCPNNFLVTATQVFIIDFEFSGIGDGWLDIATLARTGNLNDAERRTLLRSLERPDGDEQLAALEELGWISNLVDGVWAWILAQLNTETNLGDGSFNYLEYAQRQFDLLLT